MSNAGKTERDIFKLERKLKKKRLRVETISLFKIEDVKEVKSKLQPEDVLVIAGGDGTIHRIANHELFKDVKNEIMIYRCGRGNDFSRGHKGKLFNVTKELADLPVMETKHGLTRFVNGIGIGIDAYTCYRQMENFYQKRKESYFKIAWQAFRTFKQFSVDVNVDGYDYHFDNVWFFVVQNGKYFGGGMKISPKSERLDEQLEFYVIHDVGYKKLLTIFPLIFIGKHEIAKKAVTKLVGQNFAIKTHGYNLLQKDGELEEDVDNLVVRRH